MHKSRVDRKSTGKNVNIYCKLCTQYTVHSQIIMHTGAHFKYIIISVLLPTCTCIYLEHQIFIRMFNFLTVTATKSQNLNCVCFCV